MLFNSVIERVDFERRQLELVKDNEYLCSQIHEQLCYLDSDNAAGGKDIIRRVVMSVETEWRVILIVGDKKTERTAIINIIKNCKDLENGMNTVLIRNASPAVVKEFFEAEDSQKNKLLITSFSSDKGANTELIEKRSNVGKMGVISGNEPRFVFVEMTTEEYIDFMADCGEALIYVPHIIADDLRSPDYLLLPVRKELIKHHYILDDNAEAYMKHIIQESIIPRNLGYRSARKFLTDLMLKCSEKRFIPELAENIDLTKSNVDTSEKLEELSRALLGEDDIYVDEYGTIRHSSADDFDDRTDFTSLSTNPFA